MANALKIENFNPLNHDPLARRVMKNHPNLRRRVNNIWDEGITGKRARRLTIEKTMGKNYEPLF
jgi:hypothetical protein